MYIYVEIKCQLDATEVFIADLIACSTCFEHHYAHNQELKSIIQWLLPVVFRAVVFKLLGWCGAEGYVSGFQDAAASCKLDTCTKQGVWRDTPDTLLGTFNWAIILQCFTTIKL